MLQARETTRSGIPVRRILEQARRRFFPTAHDRVLARWWADGGDYALRFDYDLHPESLVLDVGGYRGQWASDLFSRYRCRIEVFEPVPAFAEAIRERFARNDRIAVHGYGLGGSSRRETISVCGDGSSILRTSREREEIEVVDVARWMQDAAMPLVQLIKINIEGMEYELLERLISTGLIRRMQNIQVQFHDLGKDSAARMERIHASLRETHEPVYQYRFVWESWRIKQADE